MPITHNKYMMSCFHYTNTYTCARSQISFSSDDINNLSFMSNCTSLCGDMQIKFEYLDNYIINDFIYHTYQRNKGK